MITILRAPFGAGSSSGHQGWESRYVVPIDPLKGSLWDMRRPRGGSLHCLHRSQTIAVGRCLSHTRGAHHAARAADIFEDHWLAQKFGEARREDASQNIARAAGSIESGASVPERPRRLN